MKSARWGSLTESVRVAAVALAVHAFLLAVDWLFFATTYIPSTHGRIWEVLRIVAFCLFAWSVLREESSRRLVGICLAAFLLTDVMEANDILRAPALTSGQTLVTIGLLLSLVVGIGALWWPGRRPIVRTPGA
jgi:hypothetical protein